MSPAEREKLYVKFEHDMEKRGRLMRLALAFDQFFNVLVWNGSQDETISSHIHRRKEKGIATRFDNVVCCCLSKLEYNHCYLSRGE